METVTSADGTTIAFERLGTGTPLVVVGGALCDRARLRDTAEGLARHHLVINYDRRGRGDSGDSPPYAVEREFEDLAALVDAAGAPAAVYGHSSGAALALRAAAHGVPMTRLVLHEPPYGPDTGAQRQEAEQYVEALAAVLAEGDRSGAVGLFLRLTGLPAEVVEGWRSEPWWAPMEGMAPTLAYDAEALGYREAGGTAPLGEAAAVKQPALVLVGGSSAGFMVDTARDVAAALPDGRLEILEGQEHVVPPEVLAPVVAAFLTPARGLICG